jgi:hypothetical protein
MSLNKLKNVRYKYSCVVNGETRNEHHFSMRNMAMPYDFDEP